MTSLEAIRSEIAKVEAEIDAVLTEDTAAYLIRRAAAGSPAHPAGWRLRSSDRSKPFTAQLGALRRELAVAELQAESAGAKPGVLPTIPGTPAPAPSVDGLECSSEAERLAARILNGGQPADEIDAVALRIVGEPTAESEIDRIARRIAGVDA